MTDQMQIVVVSYRTDGAAHDCIDSIRRTVGGKYRLTLVDASEERDGLRSVRGIEVLHPGNVGYAGALNAAFVMGEGGAPYLLACNADVTFPTGGLGRMLDLMRMNPMMGVIGPRQVNDAGRIVHAGIDVLGDTLGGRGYGSVDVGQFREPLIDVAQVSGSVMLIRAVALRAVCGVPQPGLLYFEDAALCRALRHAGWRVAYSGTTTFRHAVALSPAPPGRSRTALAAESRAAFEEAA